MARLIITRRPGETIVIGPPANPVAVITVEKQGRYICTAAPEVEINRGEVATTKRRDTAHAAESARLRALENTRVKTGDFRPHSIHCAGYRGINKPWDETACDCRADEPPPLAPPTQRPPVRIDWLTRREPIGE